MPTPKRSAAVKSPPKKTLAVDAASVVADLKRLATKATLDGMARYAIPSTNALGVKMSDMQQLAKRIGKDHALAEALWKTGVYEARTMSAFVDDPALVTPAQMDRWAADFDSWAICDTLCFKLFDKTPHAFVKIAAWAKREEEFVKRAAFALLASVALHDTKGPDAPFVKTFPLIERASTDERNFVKKGVSWALRGIGHRNAQMRAEAVKLAERLAASEDPAARWIGKDVLRDLRR